MTPVLATLLLLLGPRAQDAPAPAAPPAPPAQESAAWTAGLVLDDLDAREAFLDGLLDDARRSPERLGLLRGWLGETAAGDGELAWTARLALRELDRPASADPLTRLLVGEELLLPDGRVLSIAMSEREVTGEGPGVGLDAWVAGVTGGASRFPVASHELLGDCTLELRLGPDWASLRLLEPPVPTLLAPDTGAGADGGTLQAWTTRVSEYHGRSLAELVAKNPDLVGLLPFEVPGVAAAPPGPRSDVLGVFARPLAEGRCVELGLSAGCGLEVVRVHPGTVAEVLGIAPGSIVVEVCGIEVRGPDGIQVAMGGSGAHHPDEALCVVWLDAFGKAHRRTWKRGESPPPAEAPRRASEDPQGLRPVGR